MIAALHQDQYIGINDKMMFLARDHGRLHDALPFARSSEKKNYVNPTPTRGF